MDYWHILEDTMQHLQRKLGSTAEIWYSGVQFVGFDGKRLVLCANSQTRCSILKRSGGAHICEVLKQLHNLDVEIVILDDRCAKIPGAATASEILRAVGNYFSLEEQAICDPDAKIPIRNARKIAMYLIYRYTDLSYKDIGMLFGRDISTVEYAVMKIDFALQEDMEIRKAVQSVIQKLG